MFVGLTGAAFDLLSGSEVYSMLTNHWPCCLWPILCDCVTYWTRKALLGEHIPLNIPLWEDGVTWPWWLILP